MAKIFERPKSMQDVPTHYCPGCHHGIIHRLVAEVIDELGIQDNTVGIVPVGCSVFAYDYIAVDAQQAAHGRAPAVATGVKRVLPDNIVFAYQGDGDLAAIGTAEIVHAAARSEKITVIFVNNAIFGMTGGQMAPTTLLEQKTSTSPLGRCSETAGYPLRVSEMLATQEGAAYIARVAVNTPGRVNQAKAAIKKAFEVQVKGLGFAMVEVLSACPTNWRLTPLEANKWIDAKMIPYYPLGEFKTPGEAV